MQFIHLTTRRNLSGITRNGLLPRPGRSGRGVYCVPSLKLNLGGVTRDGDQERDIAPLHRMSLIGKWKPLLQRRYSFGKRQPRSPAAAVVFSLEPKDYPIHLFLESSQDELSRVLTALHQARMKGVRFRLNDRLGSSGFWVDFAREKDKEGLNQGIDLNPHGWAWIADSSGLESLAEMLCSRRIVTGSGYLTWKLFSARELGLLWNLLVSAEFSGAWDIEIIVPHAVPARQIDRVIPFFHKNHRRKDLLAEDG